MNKLKAISLIGGVGSMLIGAKKQGYEILFGTDWRKYYHNPDPKGPDTFTKYFKAPYYYNLDEAKKSGQDLKGIDLVVSHTECGQSSNLRLRSIEQRAKTSRDELAGDTPLLVEMLKEIKPKFFMMDNLPRLLESYTWKNWHEVLPEYDIFFEWISNYNYGNIQKGRKRLFVIGAKKEYGYVFRPGEFDNITTVKEVIEDLSSDEDDINFNHLHLKDDEIVRGWAQYMMDHKKLGQPNQKVTLKQFKKYIKPFKLKENFPYTNKKGESKKRIGHMKINLDGPAGVIYGGGASGFDHFFRPDTLNPMTMRERARVQGTPDNFIFYPLEYTSKQKYYDSLMKQTGKFMPVQFTTYLTQQIKDCLESRDGKVTDKRFLSENSYISEAKRQYCKNVGYSCKQVCEFCGVFSCRKCPNKREISR